MLLEISSIALVLSTFDLFLNPTIFDDNQIISFLFEISEIKDKIFRSKQSNTFYNIREYTLKLEEAFEKVHLARLADKKPSSIEIN